MKKLYLSLALALGLAGATPAAAQTQELVVTDQGTEVTSLEQLSELAASETPVMLFNNGHQRFMENHPMTDGSHKLLVGYEFEANATGNKSFLWKLESAGENQYRLISSRTTSTSACTPRGASIPRRP